MKIIIYFILFILYSFIGWILEIVSELKNNKRFVNRGFLIGPYCPIYGFAGILVTLLLKKYEYDPIVLFVMSMLLCSILEYITSYLMEKLFHARWWDYTEKKFTINGRIYLGTMIPFGILGCILIYIIDPFLESILLKIPSNIIIVIFVLLSMLFVTDCIVSVIIISKIAVVTKKTEKDNTKDITQSVKKYIYKNSVLGKRLIKSFPKFTVLKNNNRNK